MDNQLITSLLPLVGVLLGSSIAILGNYLSKKQERNSQIFKLLIDKRIDAYEKILGVTQSIKLSIFKVENDKKISCPMILAKQAKDFDYFYLHLIEAIRNNGHLIDNKLNYKTMNLRNYLDNLYQYLKDLRGEDGEWKNPEIVEKLGYFLSEDFRKLTSEIEIEISRFFSKDIYRTNFRPSTLDKSLMKEEIDIPADFLDLKLFKNEKEIEKLISNVNQE